MWEREVEGPALLWDMEADYWCVKTPDVGGKKCDDCKSTRADVFMECEHAPNMDSAGT